MLPLTSRFHESCVDSNCHLLVQIQQWKLQNDMCNLFKVSNKETKLRQWRCSGVFIINFEHVSHIILLFSLLSSNKFITEGGMFPYSVLVP